LEKRNEEEICQWGAARGSGGPWPILSGWDYKDEMQWKDVLGEQGQRRTLVNFM